MMIREVVLHTLKCSPNQYPQMLDERFPHVLEKVVRLWNTAEVDFYIADLLHPTRSGGRFDRSGFPDRAWQEIFQLQMLRGKLRS
ncbi:MAG: hypothetical protein WAW02_12915 [Sideroxyarcus sp.]